jgi:hypothetical protein
LFSFLWLIFHFKLTLCCQQREQFPKLNLNMNLYPHTPKTYSAIVSLYLVCLYSDQPLNRRDYRPYRWYSGIEQIRVLRLRNKNTISFININVYEIYGTIMFASSFFQMAFRLIEKICKRLSSSARCCKKSIPCALVLPNFLLLILSCQIWCNDRHWQLDKIVIAFFTVMVS